MVISKKVDSQYNGVISDKQFELLKLAHENGGLDYDMAREIYWHNSSAFTAIDDLCDKNMLEREEAPPASDKKVVFFLSEYGKSLVESQITAISDD